VCTLHCAQLLHTILHRTDLILFPLTLQTITVVPMTSIRGKREATVASVINLVRSQAYADHTERPPLCAARLPWCSASRGIVSDSWCLYNTVRRSEQRNRTNRHSDESHKSSATVLTRPTMAQQSRNFSKSNAPEYTRITHRHRQIDNQRDKPNRHNGRLERKAFIPACICNGVLHA